MEEAIFTEEKSKVLNEKAFRKEAVKKMINDLRCIDVATNIFGLNIQRCRENQRYVKPIEHTSMVFDLKKNIVYWNAKSTTPFNVVDFFCEYEGLSKFEGINKLLDFYYQQYDSIDKEIYIYDEALDETYRDQEFTLPLAYENNDIAIKYLTEKRHLDKDLVNQLIEKNIIYEDTFHNAVFVGYDCKNPDKPVFACRRGTGNTKFQLDVYGSNKINGLFIPCPNPTHTVVVTEAVIDGLSYASLTKEHPNAHILCSSGCGSALSVLKYNLFNNEYLKDINNIHLMLDLDDAGKTASSKIIEAYKDKSLFKSGDQELPERKLNVKSVNYSLKGHENLKIKDLNQLCQAKAYYEENRIAKERMKEKPEEYETLKEDAQEFQEPEV